MEFDMKKADSKSEEIFATKSEVVIYIATDYSKFSLSEYNRDPSHYKKIVESIEKNDFTKYSPILVDENLIIIDGQNRYLACKELGLPIHFIVSENVEIFDAPDINKVSKNWSTLDFARHYASRGREDYIKLLDYIHKYDQKLSTVMTFGTISKGNSSHSKSVVNGDFKLREDIDIDDFFEHMKIFEPFYNFAKKDRFVKAVLRLYGHENYDKETMLRKLKLTSAIVREQPRVDMMVEELLKLYNYKSKAKITF